MTTMNLVAIAGRLTRDPVVRKTASGVSVADLGVAINEAHKNEAGEATVRTCFVDVTAWGRQAETCGQYLRKGSAVLIEGRLAQDRWEDKSGGRRSRLKVQAGRIQFLDPMGRNGGEDGRGARLESGGDRRPVRPADSRRGPSSNAR